MGLDTRYIPAFFLEENFIDKDTGLPLLNGKVYFYKDKARATLKTIYTISGSPPNYSYVSIANPYTLNPAGSFKDDIPYLLPQASTTDSTVDLYYIEVYNSSNVLQFVREAVPNIGETQVESVNDDNFILNSQFRLFDKTTLDLKTTDEEDVALLWKFQKSNTTATDKITLESFPLGLNVEGAPTYYMHFECTSAGSGESSKDFRYRFPDVNSFQNQIATFSLLGKSSDNSIIDIRFIQNFGSGGSATVNNSMGTIELLSDFSKLSLSSYAVPTIDGKTVGTDSYVDIIIRMPLNAIADAGFTNIQLNSADEIFEFKNLDYNRNTAETLGALYEVPTDQDEFLSYKLVNNRYVFDRSIIGKVEQYTYGDVPDGKGFMKNQTVVRTDKIPNSKVKYDRLYQVWDNDSVMGNGNAFGYGSDGFFPELYTNNTLFAIQGSGSVTDWQDSSGAPTGFTFTKIQNAAAIGFTAVDESEITDFTVTNAAIGIVTDATIGTTTFTLKILQQGTAALPEITQIIPKDGSEITGGQYFLISGVGTDYYVWFTVNGAGADPVIGGRTGIQVDLQSTNSQSNVASIISGLVDQNSDFNSVTSALDTVRVTNTANGVVTAPTTGTSPFTVHIIKTGTASIPEVVDIQFTAGSLLSGSEYFEISSATTDFYFWYKVDGAGSDPSVGGRTGVLIEILSTDSSILVAQRTIFALNGKQTEKVTTNAASTLTGGEYFEANNVGTPFYVWYDIDDGSTDPAVVGKIAIEVDISAADTDAQVAQKTSKAISSYYYVIPDYEGYFIRVWNNGSSNDPDAVNRINRGDGVGGDVPGTIQKGLVGPHAHEETLSGHPMFGSGDTNYPSIGSYGGLGAGTADLTNLSTDIETRPLNRYLAYFINL